MLNQQLVELKDLVFMVWSAPKWDWPCQCRAILDALFAEGPRQRRWRSAQHILEEVQGWSDAPVELGTTACWVPTYEI